MSQKQTVYVGLSGGVDSAVSAKRLVEAGYTVVGVFIKVWQPDFLTCNWEAERLDAMRVAAHLNIPFLTFDAEERYKTEVAEYMIREYREGRTPNPDVMCNQHVKFGAFLDFALQSGADMVATGHYAQVEHLDTHYELKRGVDSSKDQSYFLWTLTQDQLSHILFPVGDSTKTEIRKEAERAGIPIFDKQDSQGICFLGQVDIEEFLSHYVHTERGEVHDELGNCIGSHSGAIFYTLGQRHGFTVETKANSSLPHYVVQRDTEKNTITVSTTPRFIVSESEKIRLTHLNWIVPKDFVALSAQFRYRQKPFTINITERNNEYVMLSVPEEGVETPSVGQSCVLYSGETCIGGGIIS